MRDLHKPSTKMRPSPTVYPGSPSLPRQYGSIAFHCALVSILRLRTLPRFHEPPSP
jgi:hypothetical protein